MPVYPIPNDWAGEDWECFIVEWPNSVQWIGLLRGLITTPVRGRFWDGETGSIIDAQNIGLEIEGRNPVTVCEEMVTALQGIQTAVEGLELDSTLQVAIQTNIQNNIDLVATAVADSLAAQSVELVAASLSQASAQATAFAWSKAIAENLLSVQIINNTEVTFRPIEVAVDPPPQPSEAGPTGITDVLDSTTPSEICKRVYWLVRGAVEFFVFLDQVADFAPNTVLGIGGMLADALWSAGLRASPTGARFLIPAAQFLGAVHSLGELLLAGNSPFEDQKAWIEWGYQDLVCELAQGVEADYTTDQLRQLVRDSMDNYGLSFLHQMLPMLIFNYSSLAALYYVSSELDPAPAIPASEPADICSVCGE